MKNLLFVYSIITSCIVTHRPFQSKQGLAGTIYVQTGNHMPSPGRKLGPGKPLSATIFIYRLTKRDQAVVTGTYFDQIQTQLAGKTKSDGNGAYFIELPPGHYSVFADDGGHLYANNFDGMGNINPVEVKKDSISKLDITISSKAVY
jgi:hypothetical protein